MDVSIKKLAVAMQVKNTGVEFQVNGAKGGGQMGDLVVTKMGLIWCEGKTAPKNGKKVSWEQFRSWMLKQN